MLGQRRRRWPNIKAALGQCLIFFRVTPSYCVLFEVLTFKTVYIEEHMWKLIKIFHGYVLSETL